MYGRRMSRSIRRMGRPNVLAMLQHANQLLISGDYSEAALAFEQLARGAEERFSERAPFLYLEAGRAALLAGQTQTAVSHLRRGLSMLGSQGRYRRMIRLGQHAITELNLHGFNTEAEEISVLITGNLPKLNQTEEKIPEKNHRLPAHCPNCGGSLRPDEFEWLDEVTVECAYCGSPVHGDA